MVPQSVSSGTDPATPLPSGSPSSRMTEQQQSPCETVESISHTCFRKKVSPGLEKGGGMRFLINALVRVGSRSEAKCTRCAAAAFFNESFQKGGRPLMNETVEEWTDSERSRRREQQK